MINIKYPVSKGKRRGFFETSYEQKEVIKNKILILLNTSKFERVFNPSFGLNLKKYLFQPITNSLPDLIKEEIIQQIQKYIPEIDVKKLDINLLFDQYKIEINLIVILKQDLLEEPIEINTEINI